MLTTRIVIEVKHRKDIPLLANLIAQRAYTIDGVTDTKILVDGMSVEELQAAGFSLAEISLGAEGEIHRT